jgi:Flp pilus assembly protein TadG
MMGAKNRRGFWYCVGGTAAIEFAIIGGVFSALLVVSGDIGLAYYSNMQVETSAQVGAQFAVIHGYNTTAIQTAVTDATSTTGITATPAPTQFCACPSGTTLCIAHPHHRGALSLVACQLCPDFVRHGAHQMKTFLRDRKGGTAIEFALTAPAFFLLAMGAVEVGLLCWAQLALQQGSEAAARCASINKTICGTTAQIQTYASAQSFGLAPATSTFTVSNAACGNRVQASYNPPFLTGFAMSSVTLTASACFPA